MSAVNFMMRIINGPAPEFKHDRETVWQDDAACAFQPPTLFEVAYEHDPIAEGLSVNEIKDLNRVNLEAAQKICNTCPVWDICYTSADPSDFKTTMRAGIMPTKGMMLDHGRPSNDPSKPCKNDHDLGSWRSRPGKVADIVWFCRDCKARKPKGWRAGDDEAIKPCKAGHDTRHMRFWDDGKRRECMQCTRERRGSVEKVDASPDDICPNCDTCDWGYRNEKMTKRWCRECSRRNERRRYQERKADVKLES